MMQILEILAKISWQHLQPIPLLLAVGLSYQGRRKGSLSRSGAWAALLVGYTVMSVPLRAFGIMLIVFYLVGSRATKAGKALKAKLEDGHHEAGNRGGSQVLCNSFSAVVAAVLWDALYSTTSLRGYILFGAMELQRPYDFGTHGWCPLLPPEEAQWSRALLFVTLGHFACCLGDTLASELGILSPTRPLLITTLRPVPPGTNGGMSLYGTLASLAGGSIMGLTLAVSLLVQAQACTDEWQEVLLSLLLWGTLAGGLGSLLDSLLGATVQMTRYSGKNGKILTDESGAPLKDEKIRVVSGLNILTNNQVNLLSSILTSLAMGALA